MDNRSIMERGRRIKMAADVCLLQSSRGGSRWSEALRRRLLEKEAPAEPLRVEDTPTSAAGSEDVETRIRSLRKLVPGGEEMPVDQLLEETADYVEALQGQVSAMQTLAAYLDGLEEQKPMMAR